ncbi:ABC transporter permease [Rhizobium leguminosarum]|nr:ABC transporter permease [Rhizobium leguminosarum]
MGYWAQRLGLRELALIPIIILLCIAGASISDAFLRPSNLINILQQSSELSILVIAQSIILISGKFDLSLESIVGVAPMFAAWLILTDTSIGGSGVGISVWLAIPLVFAVGAFIGLVNGFLVVRLGLNAFITTLAMLILLRGTTVGMTNGRTMYGMPDAFLFLGNTRWLGLPLSVWIAGFLFLVFGLFMRYHRVGRNLYAIGGNAQAARVSGIPVDRMIWGVYILGGILAALAGLMLTGRIASVTASQGQNMIFYVFAAAVIGGISLNGGQGRLIGALTGVLMLGVLQNVLILAQVAAFWIDACFGAIILIALIIARFSGDGASRN